MNMREKILSALEHDGRINPGELAIMLGSTETEIANEIAAMEKEKIICGYHTLINWDKTSNEKVCALIEVRVSPQRDMGYNRIAERIYNYPQVSATYLMSGAYDLMVILEEKTMKEVASFVHSNLAPLEGVLSTATYFVLKKYKEYGTVLEDEKKDERVKVMA